MRPKNRSSEDRAHHGDDGDGRGGAHVEVAMAREKCGIEVLGAVRHGIHPGHQHHQVEEQAPVSGESAPVVRPMGARLLPDRAFFYFRADE